MRDTLAAALTIRANQVPIKSSRRGSTSSTYVVSNGNKSAQILYTYTTHSMGVSIMLFGLQQIHPAETFDGDQVFEADLDMDGVAIHIQSADPLRVAMMLQAMEDFINQPPEFPLTTC